MGEGLRTCWRCGSDQVEMVGTQDGAGPLMVQCKNCGIMCGALGAAFGDAGMLREAWNERAADAGFEELTAANEILTAANEEMLHVADALREETLGWRAQAQALQEWRAGLNLGDLPHREGGAVLLRNIGGHHD